MSQSALWLSNDFLHSCEQLFRSGYCPSIRPGMIVGRGFADIGCEVFTVLPQNRLISLLTGEPSDVTELEVGKLFHVPSVDELLVQIDTHAWDVTELSFERVSGWQIKATCSSTKETLQYDGRRVENVLLEALSYILQSKES